MECKYCNKFCKNGNSLRNHERLCKLNSNRQILNSNFNKYNDEIRDGKRAPSNQYIKAKLDGRKIIVSTETRYKLGNGNRGRVFSSEQIENLKISMRRAVMTHPESYTANNVSGRTPIIKYNGFRLKGTWELETAKWLDKNNIKWTNIINGIEYIWNNSAHLYYPDFYLIELDYYIEVKGYERDRDRVKWQSVERLIILKKDDILKIKNNTFGPISALSHKELKP